MGQVKDELRKKIEWEMVVVAYLATKFPELDEKWLTTPNEVLFGRSPYEVVMSGEGKHLIEWLESRLGLRPGVGF